MPTFFLHIQTDAGTIPDEEGFEFADLDQAINEAIAAARSLMSADVREGRLQLNSSIEVHGEGQHLASVPFIDTVVITPADHPALRTGIPIESET